MSTPSSQELQCKQQVDRVKCEPGQTVGPSWCKHRNPFIIPRPLNTGNNDAPVKYFCSGNSPYSDCGLVDFFLPLGVRNYSLEAMYVTKNPTDKKSSIMHLTDKGISVKTESDYMFDYKSLVSLPASNCSLVALGGVRKDSPSVVDVMAIPNTQNASSGIRSLGRFSLPSGYGFGSQAAIKWVSENVSSTVLAVNVQNNDGASRILFFSVRGTGYEGVHVVPDRAWGVTLPRPVVYDVAKVASSCNVQQGKAPSFKDPSCQSKIVIVVSVGTGAVAALDYDDLSKRRGAAWAGLCPSSCSPDQQYGFDRVKNGATVLYDLKNVLVDVNTSAASLGNRTVYSTRSSRSVVDGMVLIPASRPPYVPAGPLHQQMWMAMATSTYDEANAKVRASIVLVQIPEFGTGQGFLRALCPAGKYFATKQDSCKPLLERVVYNTTVSAGFVQNLAYAFRGTPEELEDVAEKNNCTVYDMDCVLKNREAFAPGQLPSAQGSGVDVDAAAAAASAITPNSQKLTLEQIDDLKFLEQQVHILYVTTSRKEIITINAAEIASECNTKSTDESFILPDQQGRSDMFVQAVNRLQFLGQPKDPYITGNSQFLFAALTRKKFELDAMIRAVEICESSSKELGDVQKALGCLNTEVWRQPSRPSLSDFVQVASICVPGMSCPSFEQEKILMMDDGYYTKIGYERILCDRGYFCRSGQRTECPPGFKCPSPGLSLPHRCDQDPSGKTSCFGEALIRPVRVPNGSIAVAPYWLPFPAPPGTKVVEKAGELRLSNCSDGDYCPLAKGDGNDLKCPQFTFCSNSSVLLPTACDILPGVGKKVQYCPAGTFDPQDCPVGYHCTIELDDQQQAKAMLKLECKLTTYCPAGSWEAKPCPAKYFCKTPSEKELCPEGYFCIQGTVDPVKCKPLSACSPGTDKPVDIWVYILIVVSFVSFWGMRRLMFRLRDRYRDQRETGRKEEEKRVQMSTMNPARTSSILRAVSSKISRKTEQKKFLEDNNLSHIVDVPQEGRKRGPSLSKRPFNINFEFKDLGLNIKGSGKSVLKGVTGEIKAGRVTAVMGPSGAGKSTFMTTLAGKAYYGNRTGKILINGKEEPLSEYSKVIGFVPQEDIMMRDMSVKENLQLSGQMRLSAKLSKKEREDIINNTIDILDLTDVRHSLIGDENTRGISGGQRKRVNIGLEMVASPVVLFLDEPTSGLDSTGSLEVCKALRNIAEAGLTVVTVIHQPRYEIFTMFHDVLLLGKGGQTVYLGPSEGALKYFEDNGFVCPPRTNPADFFMDVIAGDVLPANRKQFEPEELFEMWKRSESARQQRGAESGKRKSMDPPTERVQAGFTRMFALFLKRSFSQLLRHPVNVMIDNVFMLISALFLGLNFENDSFWAAPPSEDSFFGCPAPVAKASQLLYLSRSDQIVPRCLMTLLAISLAGAASSIRIFGTERVVYFRECSALEQPKSTVAYFIAKDASSVPQMLTGSLLFTGLFKTIASTRMGFTKLWAIVLPVYYTSYGVGIMVSVLVSGSLSQLVAFVFVFVNSLYSGGLPPIPIMRKTFLPYAHVFSFMSYTIQAFYLTEISYHIPVGESVGVDMVSYAKDIYAYEIVNDKNRLPWNLLLITFAFGVLFRVIACVAMILKDQEKKV